MQDRPNYPTSSNAAGRVERPGLRGLLRLNFFAFSNSLPRLYVGAILAAVFPFVSACKLEEFWAIWASADTDSRQNRRYNVSCFDDPNGTRFRPRFAGDACKTGSTALKNQRGGSDAMRAA